MVDPGDRMRVVTAVVTGLPRRALADEPFTVVVTGLTPRCAARFEVSLENCAGGDWQGSFGARADAAGVVDLAAVPLAGFADPDPTALLWALERDGDPRSMAGAEDILGVLTVREGDRTVAVHEFARAFQDEGVTCTEVVDPVIGALYLPPGDGPHPAVLTVSGSGGGIARDEAALLASRGFACLALAYFNYPGRPNELVEQPLEYFGEALDWLAAHPRVRADAIAVKGRSRGGELSLLLGATYPTVRAVVAVVPSGYVWGAVRAGGGYDGAAWTWRGTALPRVRGSESDDASSVASDGAVRLAPGFRAAVAGAAPEELAAAAIPVERTNGPILLVCGAADEMWDSVELSDVVLERTAGERFAHEVRRLELPDAGHLIGLPYLPVLTSAMHPVSGTRFAYGGTPAGTAAARVVAWRQVLDFLGRSLDRA